MSASAAALPFLLLRAGSKLVDGIQARMAEAGFDDVRPAHGFAFTLLARGGATTGELAAYLGVTKQAAAQMVQELEAKGYIRRVPHPTDRRARTLVLTERGQACTVAAERAATEEMEPWLAELGQRRTDVVVRALMGYADEGPIRPTW